LSLVLGALALALTPAPAPAGWHTFRADGVSIRYPPGWFATAQPLTPVTSPRQAIAVASYPLPHGSGGAEGCSPKAALDRLPPRGAFIFGWEVGTKSMRAGTSRADFQPRPRHFVLARLARYECLGLSYAVLFRDAGRAFPTHVAFRRDATAATRATALRILDSFVARPG